MFEQFKNHEIKAKKIFYISEVSKNTAYLFVKKYHYLKGAKYLVKQSFGLFCKKTNKLLGIASFAFPQGVNTLNSWFGFNNQEKTIYELVRLALVPELNGTNATSFFLGSCIKILKKQGNIKAIISLADSSRHVGSIYQVCNFKYYGLTQKGFDFYSEDGTCNKRGMRKNKRGVYIQRSQKYRYCYLIDKTLHVKYQECKHPSKEMVIKRNCCNGTKKVFDKRFNVWYTCPICTGKLEIIKDGVSN